MTHADHATQDHMLSLEWTAQQGWLPARITPYQNLSLDPATCVFHYAFECFEGMKAYKDKKRQHQVVQARPEHGAHEQVVGADSIAYI